MDTEVHQVERTLKLSDSSTQQRAGEIVRAIEGVQSVKAQGEQQLLITYDYTRISWATLCDALTGSGVYTPRGVWTRWRDSWRDLVDHNMRDNLSHRAACCSKPPPGAGKR